VKRTLAVVCALLVSSAALIRGEDAKPALGGARIAVEPPSFDFGPALPEKELVKEFSIKNYGSEDLVIDHVSTSCGCTVAALKTKVVKPGASTPLLVTLQTRQAQGTIKKTVLINSNDTSKPRYELQLLANVSGGK
jgi:hypothetical protein